MSEGFYDTTNDDSNNASEEVFVDAPQADINALPTSVQEVVAIELPLASEQFEVSVPNEEVREHDASFVNHEAVLIKNPEEERREGVRRIFHEMDERIRATLEAEIPYEGTIRGGVRKLLNQPSEYLERRKTLQEFEGIQKELALALADPELRDSALRLLNRIEYRVDNHFVNSKTVSALRGEMGNFLRSTSMKL